MALPNSPTGVPLTSIQAKMDIVYIAAVLHLRDWDEMIEAAKRVVSLLATKPGSLNVGNQMDSHNAGSYALPSNRGFNYRHNEEGMSKFWKQVGFETNSSWFVESGTYLSEAIEVDRDKAWAKVDPGMCMIWFQATKR